MLCYGMLIEAPDYHTLPAGKPTLRGIALSGKMGAGKSTVKLALMRQISAAFASAGIHDKATLVPMAMANSLKVVMQDILRTMGVDTSDVNWKIRHREQLQALGQGMRNFSPDCWVDILSRDMLKLPTSAIVFVDDVRYPNEADALRRNSLFLVRLKASPELRGKRIKLVNENHEGESALDNYELFDMVIDEDEYRCEDMGETYASMILQRSQLLKRYGIDVYTKYGDVKACTAGVPILQAAAVTA